MFNNILIYNSGGGIGDSIQILPLISTLRSEFKGTNFYYLSAHDNHFNSVLKDFKCEINTLNLNIKYFGFRWWHSLIIKKRIKKNNISKFDLIIDLQSKIRNSLILKMIPHEKFISSCLNFRLSKPYLELKKEKKIDKTIINSLNLLLNKNFQLKEYNIDKIDRKFFIESKRLLPKNNYVGLSITQGNIYRKKEWAFNNIIKFANKLIEYKKIPVFLINKNDISLKNKINSLIPNSLFPEHETNLASPALVTCLGTRLDFAVSIDNGIMHMLSLSKVPLISLFGPTDSEKFGPKYEKSIILDSKNLYNTNNVSAITVEDVLKASKQYLGFSY